MTSSRMTSRGSDVEHHQRPVLSTLDGGLGAAQMLSRAIIIGGDLECAHYWRLRRRAGLSLTRSCSSRRAAGLIPNLGQEGGIDGDPGAVAVTWAARTLFGGLALVALALIEWDKIFDIMRGPDA